eukprot:Skav219410  [mRNA]  locus=scaffold377:65360:68966:+ [translate_table: standard]
MVDWDWAFFLCGSIVVSAAAFWGFCCLVVKRRLVCQALVDFCKKLAAYRTRTHAEAKYLRKQIAIEKKKLAQNVLLVLLSSAWFNLGVILYNVAMERPRWISTSGCWILLATTVVLLVAQVPSMLTTSNLDVWSAVLQLLVLAFVSPLATSADEALVCAFILFTAVCAPAAAFSTSSSMILGVQVLFILVSLVRVFIEADEFEAAAKCSQLNNANTYVLAHVSFLPLALLGSHWAHQLIASRVDAHFRESKSNSQLSATMALLNLTCDAVVELDGDLRLQCHSSRLCALLLRNRPATLQGTKFTDLVAPKDSKRVTEILENQGTESSGASAYAFRTHLVDSCASKIRTEVFQVKYATASGEKCHIIGLRDCTDLQPLAAENATASSSELQMPPLIMRQADSVGRQLSELSEIRTVSEEANIMDIVDSIPVTSLSSAASDTSASGPVLEGTERVERVASERSERAERAKIKHKDAKDAFLEIDVEEELIKSATAPFSELAGKKLSEVSFSNFALQTCQRLCRDARRFGAAASNSATLTPSCVPDQIASFDSMPLLTGPRLVEATGPVDPRESFSFMPRENRRDLKDLEEYELVPLSAFEPCEKL